MFEGIDLYEIKYSPHGLANSLAGIQIESLDLASAEGMTVGQIFLKDCAFLLDGISRACLFFPVSSMARQNFMYIQSFSYWEAGAAYFTRRKALDSFLLIYTYEGCGELECRGQKHILRKNDACLINCRELHQYRTLEAPWKHGVLYFYGIPAEALYKDFTKQNGFFFHLDSSVDFQLEGEKLLRAYTSINP